MRTIDQVKFEARLRVRSWLGRQDNHSESNLVLEDLKAVYVFIPKIACSSVKLICAQHLGMQTQHVHRNPYPFALRSQLASRYQDYFRFGFSRNPWDRLVSCYLDKIKQVAKVHSGDRPAGIAKPFTRYGHLFHAEMSFADFIDAVTQIPDRYADPHFRSQSWFFHDEDGQRIVDYVGRFESIADDFAHVARTIHLDASLPHRHASVREPYQSYYTPQLKDKVCQRYGVDLEMLDYSFE